MTRFKTWIINEFLPNYAHEIMVDELSSLNKKLVKEHERAQTLLSYIHGMQAALKQNKAVTINIREGGATHGVCKSTIFTRHELETNDSGESEG